MPGVALPGWHPDPYHRHEHRWFDGAQWTSQVADRGSAGTDPHGAGPAAAPGAADPQYQPIGQPPPPVSARTTLWPVLVAAGLLVGAGAVVAFVLVGGDDDGRLTAEVEGIRALVHDADPPADDYELLGEDCVVDFEALLGESGADVAPAAVDDRAAAYHAPAFDDLLYNCYLGLDPRGFSLDAVELDDDAEVDDLADLLAEESDDVEVLDEEVHGGQIVLACRDLEFPTGDGGSGTDGEDGEDVEVDPFCEYAWTYDGAGLAIIVAAHESLDLDGVAALDTIVPELRSALRAEGD